jgi:hypothetical protein
MKVKDLIKELSRLDKDMEILIAKESQDFLVGVDTFSDIIEYEEKEVVEDEDGYIHDLEYDELDKNSIRREFKAYVLYPYVMNWE